MCSSDLSAKDPVCGMTVDPATAKHHADYHDKRYYFCAAGCRTKFVADPERYLTAAAAPAHHAPGETPAVGGNAVYTCPMHPEIRQAGPGACPVCGMALEPAVVRLEATANPELVDMTRRFWIGLVLALPVVMLEMGGHLFGFHGLSRSEEHTSELQ